MLKPSAPSIMYKYGDRNAYKILETNEIFYRRGSKLNDVLEITPIPKFSQRQYLEARDLVVRGNPWLAGADIPPQHTRKTYAPLPRRSRRYFASVFRNVGTFC